MSGCRVGYARSVKHRQKYKYQTYIYIEIHIHRYAIHTRIGRQLDKRTRIALLAACGKSKLRVSDITRSIVPDRLLTPCCYALSYLE